MIIKMKFEMSDSSSWPRDKWGIYVIYCKTTMQCYVGLTKNKNGFLGRWKSHRALLRMDCHDNIYLQRSYNKYGESNFYMEILELSESRDPILLQEKEIFWLRQMKAMYFENGWNIDTYDRYNKRKSLYRPRKKEKEYRLLSKDGEIIILNNIKKFCRENNLDSGNMSRVISGKQYKYKGFTTLNPDTIREYNDRINTKTFKVKSPKGEVFVVTNISKFCRDNFITSGVSNFRRMLNGGYKSCQGWTLFLLPEKFKPKKYKLISPDFIIYEFEDAKNLCLKLNLDRKIINQLTCKGAPPSFKGWHRYSDEYKTLIKDGKIYRFWSIKSFCRSNNLNCYYINKLVKSEIDEYQGFKLLKDQPLEVQFI